MIDNIVINSGFKCMCGDLVIPESLVAKLKKVLIEYLSNCRSLSREEYLFLLKLKGIRLDTISLEREEEILESIRRKDRQRVQIH